MDVILLIEAKYSTESRDDKQRIKVKWLLWLYSYKSHLF